MATRTGIEPLLSESPSLVDRVGHAVRGAILEGRLRPGEALSISDLAADLGVSHSPVREALQRLSGQGLILLRQARTAIVAPLDLADLKDVYHLRELIEVDVAGQAAPELSDDDIKTLEREFVVLGESVLDSDQFWSAHSAFHRTLMAPALTSRADRLITDLGHEAERYIRIVYSETRVLFTRGPGERHQPLLDAARTRDATAMRAALTDHLRSNAAELITGLEATLRSDG